MKLFIHLTLSSNWSIKMSSPFISRATFSCLITTPFGSPLVPLVYMIVHMLNGWGTIGSAKCCFPCRTTNLHEIMLMIKSEFRSVKPTKWKACLQPFWWNLSMRTLLFLHLPLYSSRPLRKTSSKPLLSQEEWWLMIMEIQLTDCEMHVFFDSHILGVQLTSNRGWVATMTSTKTTH